MNGLPRPPIAATAAPLLWFPLPEDGVASLRAGRSALARGKRRHHQFVLNKLVVPALRRCRKLNFSFRQCVLGWCIKAKFREQHQVVKADVFFSVLGGGFCVANGHKVDVGS